MSTRVLPGAYVSLNDLSQFTEGSTSLVTGFALKAGRGPVNEATLVTSASDFLAKYTLDGKPGTSADPTFWSIINVLAHTNQMYVVRAAKNPLYGGAVIRKSVEYGELKSAVKSTKTLTITGTNPPAEDASITILNTGTIDGTYTVDTVSSEEGTITITTVEEIGADFTAPTKNSAIVVATPIVPLTNSLTDPSTYVKKDGDLMLITGINPGAYNGDLAFTITSSVDNDDMVYKEGADIGGKICTFDTMQLSVYIAGSTEPLETFLFSRDDSAKEIDGTSLSIQSVVNDVSSYIQIRNIDTADVTAPNSTGAQIQAGAGSDGDEADASALAAAYDVFMDKTIPVSIIGNGCSTDAESNIVQQKILSVATTRKDCMVFLNSRRSPDEDKNKINSEKAQAIVSYKKGTLGSTTFYGCMYAPHVNYTDTINSTQVVIGSDSVAIAGWLDIISGISYPYAYAGPQNGLVTGVTCDWQIGDESGEASLLNDASINYVAYDGKQGRYYMQCQNTLQIANSSLRNIGCVLNVLDLKEHIAATLKEYINLPITDDLRRDIKANINNYLDPMAGTRFYNYSFQDTTTDADIAQDTLRYLLTLSLTRYANKIYCTINVVNNTFDFSILQSA